MSRFVSTADGTRIAWDEAGQGAPVLLVHGIGSTRAGWDAQVNALAAVGYRAVRFDLRGFGESSTQLAEYGMRELVDDVEALVAALGLDRFHLVGHSLGGMIAQRIAVAKPERLRSLTLASTTSHNGRRASAFSRLMVRFAEHGFGGVIGNPELRAEAEAILAEAFPKGVRLEMLQKGLEDPSPALANAWRACIDFSAKDDLRGIPCPVLVMHGTQDRLIPFRAGELVHEAISGSEWRVEEGAGHGLPRLRADSFNTALLDFLARVDAARARAADSV